MVVNDLEPHAIVRLEDDAVVSEQELIIRSQLEDAHARVLDAGEGELIGVFGLPFAHEADALRACRAALAVRDTLRQDRRGGATVGVGLAVAVENVRAQALYERLGYGDADVGELVNHWSYVDEAGQEVIGTEIVTYLVKEFPREAER